MTGKKENLFQNMSNLMTAGIDPVTQEEEIWRRYGQTVAVLVLDSSGFSRISKSHGIVHFLSRLMQMRKITTLVFATHNSRTVHFEADNVFAVFDSVDEAIACGLEIHRRIHDAKLMLTETERFGVCIGVGYGRMLYSETLEGYFSEEMNFASKLGEDVAEKGETLLTEAAFDQATNSPSNKYSRQTVDTSGVHLSYYRHKFDPNDID